MTVLGDRRPLGWTDLRVAPVALGTMQFGWTVSDVDAMQILDRYVEHGGNLIDTADMYGPNQNWRSYERCKPHLGISEATIGRWVEDRGLRDSLVIATKVRARMWDGPDGEGLSASHVTRAVEDSLRRLRTDRIDLYQAHWPDDATPLPETMETLAHLVDAGKVRYVGLSNFSALGRLDDAIEVARSCGLRIASEQPRYNLVNRGEYEAALQEAALRDQLGIICYSPLASGFLTGKYRRSSPDSPRAAYVAQYAGPDGVALVDELQRLAENYQQTPAAIALAWILAQPGITAPIAGANSVGQLDGWVAAATLPLTSPEVQLLSGLGIAASRPEYTSW